MFALAARVLQRVLSLLSPWVYGLSSAILRMLNRSVPPFDDRDQQTSPANRSPDPSYSSGLVTTTNSHVEACPNIQPQRDEQDGALRKDQTLNPPKPQTIRYVPVPGEWERTRHPHWAESQFQIPDLIPEGHIYYFTKGEYVRLGSTALVERLESGHVAKTPLPNPYDPWLEQKNRRDMEHEYEVYRWIGPSLFVAGLKGWDENTKTLTLEDQANGDLETYVRNRRDVDVETRRKWALQAAQGLATLHAVGVIHQDLTPRNFLLTTELDLRICDFASSSYPGRISSSGAPGPRYQSKVWDRGYIPTQADDIFSLGSVLYYIMAGEEPYSNLDDDEVESHFEDLKFPSTDHIVYGTAMHRCWTGQISSAEEVVQALIMESKQL